MSNISDEVFTYENNELSVIKKVMIFGSKLKQ